MNSFLLELQEIVDSNLLPEPDSSQIQLTEIDENEPYYGWDLTLEMGAIKNFESIAEFLSKTKILHYLIQEPESIWEQAITQPKDWNLEELNPCDDDILSSIPDMDEYQSQDPEIIKLKNRLEKSFQSSLVAYRLESRYGRIDEDITTKEIVYFWNNRDEYSIIRIREKILH